MHMLHNMLYPPRSAVGSVYSHSMLVRFDWQCRQLWSKLAKPSHYPRPCLYSTAAHGRKKIVQTMDRLRNQRRRRAGGRDQQVRISFGNSLILQLTFIYQIPHSSSNDSRHGSLFLPPKLSYLLCLSSASYLLRQEDYWYGGAAWCV